MVQEMSEELINGLNIKARIYPSNADCRNCMATASLCNAVPRCYNCYKEKDVTIVQFIKGACGAYGIVIDEKGNIKEVPIEFLKAIDNKNSK